LPDIRPGRDLPQCQLTVARGVPVFDDGIGRG
jgi:hypothetical protein